MPHALQIGCFRYAITALVAALLSIGAVQAREGFYLGGGLVSQSASGDLDGENALINAAATKLILAGSLDTGFGLAFRIGYGFNEFFGIENIISFSSHTANHDLVDDSSEASITTALYGVRLSLPASDNLEVFARAGFGIYTVTYESYGLTGFVSGSTFVILSETEVEFSGTGTGIGIGAEMFFGSIGVEVGFTQHSAQLDRLSGVGFSNEEIDTLDVTITTIDVVVVYYF